MMRDAIINFPKQFKWKPKIEGGKLKKYRKFLVCGMGGSHLGAGLLRIFSTDMDTLVHRNYGLPSLTEEQWKRRLVILSSYSGNTEEVISAYEKAKDMRLPMAVIAAGGKLFELARQNSIPFVAIPNTGIQPRSSLGYQLRGLAKLMKLSEILKESGEVGRINPKELESQGKELATAIKGKVPVIYSSYRLRQIAYNWKIKFNETGKIPAFQNVLPELNHNEMNGFDVKAESKNLTEQFHFICLKDENDHPRIIKRMEVLEKLYQDRQLPVSTVSLSGQTLYERVFKSLILADWTALYTAEIYGLDAEQVPMVEEFKSLIAKN